MPPVSIKKDGSPKAIQKDVEFVAKDADEQVATGIVMVPDKVDLQNDFIREDQIREFAEQFEDFEAVGQAGGGIMHAVFPGDEWMRLERNEVLDEATEIGGVEAPAGAWVQDWSVGHEKLWGLIDDEIFAGYSIGLDAVRWGGPYEQEELEDVDVPPEIDEDELVWEIVEGISREVSAVDIPAVPDAEILEAKAEKRLADHIGNRDAFVEEAMERGHGEAAAERMWDVLNEAAEIEGAGQPGKDSVLARLGKNLVEAVTLGAVDVDGATAARSTSAKTAADDDSDDDEDGDEDEDDDEKDAPGGDTPDDDTTDMSDNPDDDGESKDLAEKNAEQISELTDTVKDLTETIAGPEPKTAEIEIGGETYEVREEAAKAALGVDEDTSVGDAIEQLNEEVERTKDRIDAINRQHGGSGQVDPAAATDENDDESGLEGLGKVLS